MKTQLRAINFILIVALSCFFQFAKAQIVYTDVDPDLTKTKNPFSPGSLSYYLDLNNDGTADFKIKCYFGGVGAVDCYVQVEPLDSNEVVMSAPRYDSTMLIDTSLSWSSSSFYLRHYHKKETAIWTGLWINATDGYLALKLIFSGQKYFGWVKLSVHVTNISATFTIKDYGYNSIPDQNILAGQVCPPQAMIITDGPTTFCLGDSVILSSANSGTNLSYKWKLNGNNISGATNKSYSPKVAGKYKVNVTDNTNGCSATSALVKVKVPCRILNEELTNSENDLIKVYPNPASNKITLSFSSSEKKQIQITNTLRQIVFAEEINSAKKGIDVSEFPAGMYVVSAQTSTQRIEKKFLKQ